MTKQFIAFIFIGALAGATAWAADPAPKPTATAPADDTTAAERVNTDSIKEKYWARGDENEIGVVQNRLYSKEHKYELSLLTGVDITDPMLTVYTLGARLGYHFSEYFSVHVIGWKAFSSPSGTQSNLLANKSADQVGTALNTNEPLYYFGSEAQWSLLYGKLSVVGKAIIHYDLHFVAGLGAMNTESGMDFEQHVGIGQQFFLSQSSFLNVDYRMMHYHETILQKVIPTELGQSVGTRENFSSVITIGVGFLFGSGVK
jgi:outer membrane beta-barrel protein